MVRVVQKFGGNPLMRTIRNAAKKVKAEVDAGNEVAVVVSAMAGVTNQMVDHVTQLARCVRVNMMLWSHRGSRSPPG